MSIIKAGVLCFSVIASGISSAAVTLKGTELVIPTAYRQIGASVGVPAPILYAMALAESGMRMNTGAFRPYPWTLATRGEGKRFSSQEETVKYLRDLLARRVTNVDVGLLQTNMYWHGYRYASPAAAVSPWNNLREGAEILATHYGKWPCKKDWWCAVGRYHSYRKDDALAYAERVKKYYTQLGVQR